MERFLLGKRKLDETARRPDQAATTGEDGGRVTPCTVLSWNANGLMARIEAKRHMEEFGQLVTRLSPDVVCIQEARIAAYCANLKVKKDSPDPRVRWRPADKEKHELEKALGAPPFTSMRRTCLRPPGPRSLTVRSPRARVLTRVVRRCPYPAQATSPSILWPTIALPAPCC